VSSVLSAVSELPDLGQRSEPTRAALEIFVAVSFQNLNQPVDEAARVGLPESFAVGVEDTRKGLSGGDSSIGVPGHPLGRVSVNEMVMFCLRQQAW